MNIREERKMNMRININDVGHFSSVAEARDYQTAMQAKQNIEGAASAVIPFDDVVNIDMNSPGKGDILIDNVIIKTKAGEYAYEGRVICDSDKKEVMSADLTMASVCSPMNQKLAISIKKDDQREIYDRTGVCDWASQSGGFMFSTHDRVIIDRKAGYIEYESFRSDAGKPQLSTPPVLPPIPFTAAREKGSGS